jgi:hypothetical protein
LNGTGHQKLKISSQRDFSNSAVGRLILLNLQYLQLEAGIGECLLENPNIVVDYLTPSWLVTVRRFLALHNVSVMLTDQPTIELASPNDQFIMQAMHLQ